MRTVIYEILQISVCSAASLFVTTVDEGSTCCTASPFVVTSKQKGEKRRVNVYEQPSKNET
jgi:hypothetical protein